MYFQEITFYGYCESALLTIRSKEEIHILQNVAAEISVEGLVAAGDRDDVEGEAGLEVEALLVTAEVRLEAVETAAGGPGGVGDGRYGGSAGGRGVTGHQDPLAAHGLAGVFLENMAGYDDPRGLGSVRVIV